MANPDVINKGTIYPDAPLFIPEAWNRGLGASWSARLLNTIKNIYSLGYLNNNAPSRQTNCYEYAVNANKYTDEGTENPGNFSYDLFHVYNKPVEEGILIDGAIPYEGDGLPPNQPGYYPIALFQITGSEIYHFMRANKDGTWSSTAGRARVKLDTDIVGNPITEPHQAIRGTPYRFEQYFYVPKDGLITGGKGEIVRAYNENGLESAKEAASQLTQDESFANLDPIEATEVKEIVQNMLCDYRTEPGLKRDIKGCPTR